MSTHNGPSQDFVALAEIELCGELMIAASAAGEERLSFARIDEVLEVDRTTERQSVRIPAQAARRPS
ncbi:MULTISPECIES: hypothetical protein [unclassified Streptomyces]|uniref:hypothetical protein n=1 Tax=unclassified Streptomyces TaxID=2593676 RepID=UPI00203399B4|nr:MULTISPECIES: hypothetical protein [unclassified Streptomyces]MCM2420732.1 hypothetical protein [Streptomyces sp. RKAG293]MCM2427089.1 hypothetical protein [Streptomyces sp. RKAG337]